MIQTSAEPHLRAAIAALDPVIAQAHEAGCVAAVSLLAGISRQVRVYLDYMEIAAAAPCSSQRVPENARHLLVAAE